MDKIPELLLKLLENSSLATLFSGVFLIVLSGAGKLPFVSTLSPTVKTILLAIGIILILISPLILFKDGFSRLSKTADKSLEAKTQKEIDRQRNEIAELNEIIERIKELVESKNDNVSLSICEIFDGVKDQAREFERATQESLLTAKWLSGRKQSILKAVKSSGANPVTSRLFYSEMEKYFELIVESFERFTYIEPKKRNITSHIHQPFPYIEAIQTIKLQVNQELDKHQGLDESEILRLYACIDRLIENIRRESSS